MVATLSPVSPPSSVLNALVSTFTILASAGIFSPARTLTTSPGTRSTGSTCPSHRPSRSTAPSSISPEELMSTRAERDFSADSDCATPVAAFRNSIDSITRGSMKVFQRLSPTDVSMYAKVADRTATARSIWTRRSSNCSTRRKKMEADGGGSTLLGPRAARRRATSEDASPKRSSTSRIRRTSLSAGEEGRRTIGGRGSSGAPRRGAFPPPRRGRGRWANVEWTNRRKRRNEGLLARARFIVRFAALWPSDREFIF
mmetsp:Transcript_48063/g.93893  ORF Transcript_48063/g.93893 Transcript_48063/m.93893 type:complete len:257 (-) Transcript_48063:35-805(-)